MLAAMLARALMTAKEQCLRRKNSYEQAIPQVLYFQCFLHITDSNSCDKATDILSPSLFSCCFYEHHITLLTMQLVFKWKTIFQLCLWRMLHLWCMATRKVLPVADKKQPRTVFLFWESSWAEESELQSVVESEMALLKHTDRNSPPRHSHSALKGPPPTPTTSRVSDNLYC